MAETTTNRGATRYLAAALAGTALDLRMVPFLGTQVGVHDRALNTLADLDAVAGVSLHSEGAALAGETATEDDPNFRGVAGAQTVPFAAAPGVTAQGMAIYEESGGTDATRNLMQIYTTGFPQPMDGGLNVAIPNGFLNANSLTG